MNKVFLKGKLTKDVELKHGASGAAYASFSMATNESKKDKDGNWQNESEFHNCIAFGKTAERIAQMPKGGNIVAIGKIKTESWEKDGKKNYMTRIYVEHVEGWITYKREQTSESVINREFQPQANSAFSENIIPF